MVSGSPLHERWGPWYSITLTPGKDPFESLARALMSDIYGVPQRSDQSGADTETPQRPGPDAKREFAIRRKEATSKSLARILKEAHAPDSMDEQCLEKSITEFLRRRYQYDGEALAEFLYSEIDRFHADFSGDTLSATISLVVISTSSRKYFGTASI
jgi:hypothetical protein